MKSLSAFKEEMTDEIDLFWQNRVLNAQIIIQEKSADLIRGLECRKFQVIELD